MEINNLADQCLGFIGLGNIGGMLAERALHHKLVSPDQVYLFDHHPENIRKISANYRSVQVCADEEEVCRAVDRLVIAISPTAIPKLLCKLRKNKQPDVALPELWLTTSHLNDEQLAMLWPRPCITCLPTLAGALNRGVVLAHYPVNMPAESVADFEIFIKPQCKALYWVAWEEFPVPNNLTGCAPAFVAYIIQAMAEAAAARLPGFSPDDLAVMAAEALTSTVALLEHRRLQPAELLRQVGAPGGITYTALSALQENFPQMFVELIRRSVERHNVADQEVDNIVRECIS